jgi:hypothetical protein
VNGTDKVLWHEGNMMSMTKNFTFTDRTRIVFSMMDHFHIFSCTSIPCTKIFDNKIKKGINYMMMNIGQPVN